MSLKLNLMESKISNDTNITEVIQKTIFNDWKPVFDLAVEELEFISQIIKKKETNAGISFPHKEYIFRAFQLTPLASVKAVFIATEPYNGVNYDGSPLANGLAFSVNENCTISKDLMALYNEVQITVPTFKIPTHGNLMAWALQGILLLNLALTVTPNTSGSHGEIWLGFMSKVIETLAIQKPTVPFVLFGKDLDKYSYLISGKSTIIKSTNPSDKKFHSTEPIKKLITALEKNKIDPINWQID